MLEIRDLSHTGAKKTLGAPLNASKLPSQNNNTFGTYGFQTTNYMYQIYKTNLQIVDKK
jgi:hypothetical protein